MKGQCVPLPLLEQGCLIVCLTVCFSVQINVRVHHAPDTSVVIHPLEQSDIKLPQKMMARLMMQRHKPKGRCFQETTPKQAVSNNQTPYWSSRAKRRWTFSDAYFHDALRSLIFQTDLALIHGMNYTKFVRSNNYIILFLMFFNSTLHQLNLLFVSIHSVFSTVYSVDCRQKSKTEGKKEIQKIKKTYFPLVSKSWEIGTRNTVDQMCEGPLCKLGLCPSPCVSRWACSVTAPPCRCSPTRRTVAAAWGTPGDRTNATSAPNYQVSPSSGHMYISLSLTLSLSLSPSLALSVSLALLLSLN